MRISEFISDFGYLNIRICFFMIIKKLVVGQLQTNCYVLIDGGVAAVIDPGDEAQKIAEAVAGSGAVVGYIINTHNHFDHVGGNDELKSKFGAKIMIHGRDAGGRIFADVPLKEGDILDIGDDRLRVIETPGHTAGSVCLSGADFVISGDTLFADGFGRTDLPGGSNSDMAMSLEKIDRVIPEGVTVYPGHGDIFKYRKGMALAWLDYLG